MKIVNIIISILVAIAIIFIAWGIIYYINGFSSSTSSSSVLFSTAITSINSMLTSQRIIFH